MLKRWCCKVIVTQFVFGLNELFASLVNMLPWGEMLCGNRKKEDVQAAPTSISMYVESVWGPLQQIFSNLCIGDYNAFLRNLSKRMNMDKTL